MSDSSDDGGNFNIRDYDEESDEDSLRPTKRRKTQPSSYLRMRGQAFQKATADDEENEDEEDDIDDERPTMGGLGMRAAFNIGQFQPAVEDDEPSPSPEVRDSPQPDKMSGQGPSAFHSGGKVNQSSFAARMMAKMGHKEGQGLGKSGQGIAAPIQAQKLQQGSGLGFGSQPERPKPVKKEKKSLSGASTPGTATPRVKAPPKKKYEISAIESRGLHVPESLKNIIDATGAEQKTLTSLSGYSTPTSDTTKTLTEAEKKQARLKRDLQLFADAWDGQVLEAESLDQDVVHCDAEIQENEDKSKLFADMVTSFERVAVDDSHEHRSFDHVIARLQSIQSEYPDYIDPLDLTDIAVATLDRPLHQALTDLDDLLQNPGSSIVSSLTTISSLLQLTRITQSRHRRHTTSFESLLLKHLYPLLRTTFRNEWTIYDPLPALTLLETWYPTILPPWLVYNLCQEVILPRLLEGVRKFKSSTTSTSKRRDRPPDIHEWIFDWYTLFETLDLESFHQLKIEIKQKVRFDERVWPKWEPLLGSRHKPAAAPKVPSVPTSTANTPPADDEEITFRHLLDEWCNENDIILRATGNSDLMGRRLFKLQPAEKPVGGLVVYIESDNLFEAAGDEPWMLDEELVDRVRGGRR